MANTVNRPPVALDDTPNGVGTPVLANPGAPIVAFVSPVSALANDTDPDAGETALLRVTQAGVSEETQIAVPPGTETAVLGTYGTLYIKPEGTWVYKLDSARAATMGLAAGTQATEQFVYTAANNGGGAGNQDTATLSIIVQGANDAPRDIAISSSSVDENVPIGAVVGTLAAFDPDGNPITWTLTDSAGGRFALDPNTGVLTVADDGLFPINFERQQSYTIVASASDGALSSTRQLTIAVNDIDEAPTLTYLQDKLPVPIRENVLAPETLYYTLMVHDDALGSWTIALSGAQADLFHLEQVSPTEYRLYFNGGVVPDYETLQAYSVSVDVDDPAMGDGPDARFSLTIPVANVEEPSTTSSVTIALDEDTPRILTSADFPCNDPDGVGMLRVEILTVPARGKLYYDPTGGDPSDAIVLPGAQHGDQGGARCRPALVRGWRGRVRPGLLQLSVPGRGCRGAHQHRPHVVRRRGGERRTGMERGAVVFALQRRQDHQLRAECIDLRSGARGAQWRTGRLFVQRVHAAPQRRRRHR